MKVKVEFTVEVTDEQRDAIGGGSNEPGHRASREEVRSYFMERGTNGLVDLADQEFTWADEVRRDADEEWEAANRDG